MQLWRGDAALPPFETSRARALFAFLALHRRRPHARELLAGRLWGDEPQESARKALRMALWRVRSVVDADEGAESRSPLRTSAVAVEFNQDAEYWLDVEEFERLVHDGEATATAPAGAEAAERLRAAVDLYRGDLLEGTYDDWCLYERERLRLLYHAALERLMRFEQERSAWGEAIALGQRLLALDPLLESVHRELMRCHVERGDRGAALRQFEECVRTLRRELDVEPMPQTRELQDRILAGATPPATRDDAVLVERMDRALDLINGIAAQLRASRDHLSPAAGSHASSLAATLLAEPPPRRG